MKINDASVALAASHSYSEKYEQHESLEITVQTPASDTVDLSVDACKNSSGLLDGEDAQTLMTTLKALLVEILSGRKVKIFDPDEIKQRGNEAAATPVATPDTAAAASAEAAEAQPPRAGWGLRYDYSATYTETEELRVAAAGVVTTADGRDLAFEMEMSMSRSFVEQHNLSLRLGDAALSDPLVLNLGGQAASLGGFSFAFDFDGDGGTDRLPGLSSGSAYLALDRNLDGLIGSGAELFGPSTDDGWKELAVYDQDSNGWIDEGDEIFSRLRLWQPQPDGNASLSSLAEQGVGAIWLKSVAQPFDLRDAGNALEGRVVSTGLFLKEDGQVGTVQQLDLVV